MNRLKSLLLINHWKLFLLEKFSLEIEDLEISMNQGQFEETIALQRQENWENEIPEEYRKPC